MRGKAVILLIVSLVLSACSPEAEEVMEERPLGVPFTLTPRPEVIASDMKRFVDSLVDRFDAQPCLGAEAIEYGGKKGEDGHEVHRLYRAESDCIGAVRAELLHIGFEAIDDQLYVAKRDRGWVERVTFQYDETTENGTIKWVEINP